MKREANLAIGMLKERLGLLIIKMTTLSNL